MKKEEDLKSRESKEELKIIMANWKTLGLVIGVVVSFFLLLWGAYSLLSSISPFDNTANFIAAAVIVLGFYVGAGFAFKKLRIF